MALNKPVYFVQKNDHQLKATAVVKNLNKDGTPIVSFNLYSKKIKEPAVEVIDGYYKFNWKLLKEVSHEKLSELMSL